MHLEIYRLYLSFPNFFFLIKIIQTYLLHKSQSKIKSESNCILKWRGKIHDVLAVGGTLNSEK